MEGTRHGISRRVLSIFIVLSVLRFIKDGAS